MAIESLLISLFGLAELSLNQPQITQLNVTGGALRRDLDGPLYVFFSSNELFASDIGDGAQRISIRGGWLQRGALGSALLERLHIAFAQRATGHRAMCLYPFAASAQAISPYA